MSQDAAERPCCQKCGGFLLPNRNAITDRVESLTCVACGETVYRGHKRRQPALNDGARGSHGRRAA